MPGISDSSSARGAEVSAKPLFTKVLEAAVRAEGATGAPPLGCSEVWETRPTCQSWMKMRPPLAWTASVTFFQPSTWASE